MAVTYSQQEVVLIHVSNDDGKFPKLPTDPDGVVSNLRAWMAENGIGPAARGGTWGGNQITAMFTREDADKIIAFLKTLGVEEDE
jgi:hypothetical protein